MKYTDEEVIYLLFERGLIDVVDKMIRKRSVNAIVKMIEKQKKGRPVFATKEMCIDNFLNTSWYDFLIKNRRAGK